MDQTQPIFNLEKEIGSWQQTMLLSALTPDDVEEITQHLRDEISGLQANGLSDKKAWFVARHRMGEPLSIDQEFKKVNPDFAANRSLLMLFWGGTIFMMLQNLYFVYPAFLRFISRRLTGDFKPRPYISLYQISVILNVLNILVLCLAVICLTRATVIATWFNNLLIKYSAFLSVLVIILGAFTAFFNFHTITNLTRKYYVDLTGDMFTFTTCGFVFYGVLLFLQPGLQFVIVNQISET